VHDAEVFKERVLRYLERSKAVAKGSRTEAFESLVHQIDARGKSSLSEASRLWGAFKEEASLHKTVQLIRSPRTD
jgi:hypothetical protein